MQMTNFNRPTESSESDSVYVTVKAEAALTEGDIVQWSNTASSAFPIGVAVEDSVADDGRLAGVVAFSDIAASDYGLVQVYGYNTNVTTDGAVTASDTWLVAGSAVAVGQTDAEIEASITTADISSLADIIGWNLIADTGTVGACFIRKQGNL